MHIYRSSSTLHNRIASTSWNSPLARLDRRLWAAYTVLFVLASVMNIRSH